MNYKMTVVIKDPKEPAGFGAIVLNLIAEFAYDEKQYGNGYSVCIKDDKVFRICYDLRYYKDFDKDKKDVWLLNWAKEYWSGTNGAYELVKFSIEKI